MSESGKIIDLGQPIEGLLYDLDLLPEQLKPNTREYQLMWVISELKKRLKELEAESGWADISTAPRDGKKIWAFCPGQYVEQEIIWWDKYPGYEGVTHQWNHHQNGPAKPTHWQPLPPPPKGAPVEAGEKCPELKRDCPRCGKPQLGTSIHTGDQGQLNGTQVFWHADGSGDDCSGLAKTEGMSAVQKAVDFLAKWRDETIASELVTGPRVADSFYYEIDAIIRILRTLKGAKG